MIWCKIITYADDTIIYFYDKNIRIIEKVLNTEFNYLSDWLTENELILNLKEDKTEIMVVGTKLWLSKVNSNINVEYHSIKVNFTKSYKYLGMKVDPSLNLSDHFQFVYKTASSRLRLFRRIRPNITKTATLRIYQAFIVPKIMYCSFIN